MVRRRPRSSGRSASNWGCPARRFWSRRARPRQSRTCSTRVPLLTAAGAGRIVIVTDRYHLPRARLVARRMGLDATGAWPRVPGPVTARRAWLWLREGGAYLGYAVQGRGRG
ncbi:ElyC/SanA/YdcF family protein [Ponticoccus litoralis]|uniref:ElyC/SanA/YdcF family protein n=1 Tax=Ponticoccus litoralis TaxID=422297 RepID=A0AAW9SLV8_9RHOB